MRRFRYFPEQSSKYWKFSAVSYSFLRIRLGFFFNWKFKTSSFPMKGLSFDESEALLLLMFILKIHV